MARRKVTRTGFYYRAQLGYIPGPADRPPTVHLSEDYSATVDACVKQPRLEGSQTTTTTTTSIPRSRARQNACIEAFRAFYEDVESLLAAYPELENNTSAWWCFDRARFQ